MKKRGKKFKTELVNQNPSLLVIYIFERSSQGITSSRYPPLDLTHSFSVGFRDRVGVYQDLR